MKMPDFAKIPQTILDVGVEYAQYWWIVIIILIAFAIYVIVWGGST